MRHNWVLVFVFLVLCNGIPSGYRPPCTENNGCPGTLGYQELAAPVRFYETKAIALDAARDCACPFWGERGKCDTKKVAVYRVRKLAVSARTVPTVRELVVWGKKK